MNSKIKDFYANALSELEIFLNEIGFSIFKSQNIFHRIFLEILLIIHLIHYSQTQSSHTTKYFLK